MNKERFITLDNGLTVFIYSDKTKITNHAELVTFFGGTNLEYKKNNEIKEIMQGTAHLLEHYVCECNNNGDYISNILKYKGLEVNAITGDYTTKYFFKTAYNFKECLNILLKTVYDIEFTKEKLDKTKYAVYNEIRDRKDHPYKKISDERHKMYYGKKIDIGGTKTSVSKVSTKELESIYKYFYVPKNQFLVVAGNFNEEEIVEQIKEFYNNYKFKDNRKRESIKVVPTIYHRSAVLKGERIGQVMLQYKIPIYNLTNFEKYKQDWYIKYFIDMNLSVLSKLYEELKEKDIIKRGININIFSTNDYQILEIKSYTNNKKEFIKRVHNVVNNPIDTEDQFELCKKESILHVSVRSDNITNYVAPIIDNYLSFDYKENDNIEFVETLNYKEYKETISNIDFSKYSTLTIKDK